MTFKEMISAYQRASTPEEKMDLHRVFYAQFVTDTHKKTVARLIGVEKILASEDPHFNDIPLEKWETIKPPLGTSKKIEDLGSWLTVSHIVCINKEAARQLKEQDDE